ncbi:MAG: DNA/RNA non-specific endonuclease [Pontiella sp.]|nr:DNA/RNA non-specific endonuclease [Pontiella sp.]MBT8045521.1 DNA/RNA non-specific endonuclease [Pontiella sp.]NNJ70873.1 DNA/RNA non-specific endonuclease [Kiritimatiellales bacterium]
MIGFIFRQFKGWKAIINIVVLCALISIGYYYLPWSVRRNVYDLSPKFDRALRKAGYTLLTGWDELALLGRDVSVPLDGTYRGDQAYGGLPSEGFKIIGRSRLLENRGYTVGYSDQRRNPLWVTYRIFDVPELNSEKRPSNFRIDYRTQAAVRHDDYTHSGYDRGHLAPNYGIATRYGPAAQRETFLMSNVIPQDPGVNRYMWKDLEMRVAKRYGRFFSEVWVITGPVFTKSMRELPSGVEIPKYYYKIIVDEHEKRLRALAFLVEDECPPFTRIKSRLTSIDQIEELTGLDFFPELPLDMQKHLEGERASRLWPWMGPALNYYLKNRTY